VSQLIIDFIQKPSKLKVQDQRASVPRLNKETIFHVDIDDFPELKSLAEYETLEKSRFEIRIFIDFFLSLKNFVDVV
jgi:hypothetical protein